MLSEMTIPAKSCKLPHRAQYVGSCHITCSAGLVYSAQDLKLLAATVQCCNDMQGMTSSWGPQADHDAGQNIAQWGNMCSSMQYSGWTHCESPIAAETWMLRTRMPKAHAVQGRRGQGMRNTMHAWFGRVQLEISFCSAVEHQHIVLEPKKPL